MFAFRTLVLRRSFLFRASLIELTFGVIVVLGLLGILDSLTKLISIPLVHVLSLIWPLGPNIGSLIYGVLVFLFRVFVFYSLIMLPLRPSGSVTTELGGTKGTVA